jgi:hypothetical protein
VALQTWGGVRDAAFFGFFLSVVIAGLIPTKSASCRIR